MNAPCWLPHWELRATNSLVKQEALSCPGASGVRRREEGRELAVSQGPGRLMPGPGAIQEGWRLGLHPASSGTTATFFVLSAIEVTQPAIGRVMMRPCLETDLSMSPSVLSVIVTGRQLKGPTFHRQEAELRGQRFVWEHTAKRLMTHALGKQLSWIWMARTLNDVLERPPLHLPG